MLSVRENDAFSAMLPSTEREWQIWPSFYDRPSPIPSATSPRSFTGPSLTTLPVELVWQIAHYLSAFDMCRLYATSSVLHCHLERELFTRVYSSALTIPHEIPELEQYRVQYYRDDPHLPPPPIWSDSTPFHMAAATGNTNAVRKYIDLSDFPIDSRCPGRRSTALLHATVGGHTDTMKFLLERGADINKGMIRGNPTKKGEIRDPWVKVCNFHSPTGDFTPLRFAIEYADLAALNMLLDHGAALLDDMGLPEDYTEWEGREDEGGILDSRSCPIHTAVIHSGNDYPKDNLTKKRKAIVRELLARGAPVDYRDADGQTALHHLCAAARSWKHHPLWPGPRYYDTQGMVRFLIQNGADMNARSFSDDTPLHYALRAHSLALTRVLIEAGADVNAANFLGLTPLHYASKEDTHYAPEADILAIVKLLIAAGADVNAPNRLGCTPLLGIWGTHANHIEIASILLEAGANPSARRKLWRSRIGMNEESPDLTLLDLMSIEIYEYGHMEKIHQQYKRRGGSDTTSLCYYQYDHQPKEVSEPNWVRDLGPAFALLKVLLKHGATTSWRPENSVKDFRILLSLWEKNGVNCGAHLSWDEEGFSGPCECTHPFHPIA